MDEYYFISFENTSSALNAESYLKKNNFSITIMPTPREVSESCGISIRINSGAVAQAKEFADQGRIKIKGIYHLNKENGVRRVEKVE